MTRNILPGPVPAAFLDKLTEYSISKAPAPTNLKLNANEGPPPPISLFEILSEPSADNMNLYVKPESLEAQIAERMGIESGQVLVTAGGDDAIKRCCTVYLRTGREMILPQPSFEMFTMFAQQAEGRIVDVSWEAEDFPIREIIAAINENTGIITVTSPNNPTGCVASAEDLRRISEAAPKALLMADMAYTHFADEDLTETVLKLPNAIGIYTFSKAWRLAGLRVGFAVGPEKLIEPLRRAGLPYPLSSVSLALAQKWFVSGQASVAKYVSRVRDERETLRRLLGEIGARPTNSQANFAFARFNDPQWIRDALGGMGIATRFIPPQKKFKGAVRITCPGNEADFARLTHSLNVVCRPQALIFDMDGVLANDSKSFRQAIIDTARSYGVSLTAKDIAEAEAGGEANNSWALTQILLRRHGTQADIKEVTERFERLYQGENGRPGLWETETLLPRCGWLQKLSERYPLAIVTGRPRKDAVRFCVKEGISEFFKFMVCAEDAALKPDPAPLTLALKNLKVRWAWMMGDTPDDIVAARRAGVLPIGIIAPGYDVETTKTVLHAAGAARVFENLQQLEGVLP